MVENFGSFPSVIGHDVIDAISFFSLLFHFFFLISSGRTWRLEDVIAKLNEKYGTLLLVNFFVGTDDRDSTSHIIHVGVCLWQGKELTSLCSYSKSPHVPLFTEGND